MNTPIGVGFDGPGYYTHASRRKSLVQRICANKRTYQGEDVPDAMTIFGVYDTGCSSRTHDSMAARSDFLRKESKAGNNKNFLTGTSEDTKASFSAKAKISTWTASAEVSASGSLMNYEDNSEYGSDEETVGRGSEDLAKSNEITNIFEFTCRIRRYEIFMDEVTPSQLSEAFLLDYIDLPVRFHDFRNKAPQKYIRFLERWGTHYIKSASFGGKFTLLRESKKSGTETKKEWESNMLAAVQKSMSSSSSDSLAGTVSAKGKAKFGFAKVEGEASASYAEENTNQTSTSSSSTESKSSSKSEGVKSEVSFSKDDIIVEGGHQHVAAILSDLRRSGFKSEFKDWLDSIPQFPKGYDFKFGELSELLDINFATMVSSMGMKPCWEYDVKNGYYEIQIKDDNGDFTTERRKCGFKDGPDFVKQMNMKRLSLKRAIAVYADNRGQTGNDLTLPAGFSNCEIKRKDDIKNINYTTLTNGNNYIVKFKLSAPIGNKISPNDIFVISFKENDDGKGRWFVTYGGEPDASQISKQMSKSENIVKIKDVDFSLVSDEFATTLEWNNTNCERNIQRFKNLDNISCSQETPENIDWVNTPLAIVKSLQRPTTFVPCHVKWSNLHMLIGDNSCVRFTAASSGPIYFVLSAIPSRFDTWYYFRITQVSVPFFLISSIFSSSMRASFMLFRLLYILA